MHDKSKLPNNFQHQRTLHPVLRHGGACFTQINFRLIRQPRKRKGEEWKCLLRWSISHSHSKFVRTWFSIFYIWASTHILEQQLGWGWVGRLLQACHHHDCLRLWLTLRLWSLLVVGEIPMCKGICHWMTTHLSWFAFVLYPRIDEGLSWCHSIYEAKYC